MSDQWKEFLFTWIGMLLIFFLGRLSAEVATHWQAILAMSSGVVMVATVEWTR